MEKASNLMTVLLISTAMFWGSDAYSCSGIQDRFTMFEKESDCKAESPRNPTQQEIIDAAGRKFERTRKDQGRRERNQRRRRKNKN